VHLILFRPRGLLLHNTPEMPALSRLEHRQGKEAPSWTFGQLALGVSEERLTQVIGRVLEALTALPPGHQ
jgi:hypothetical protein